MEVTGIRKQSQHHYKEKFPYLFGDKINNFMEKSSRVENDKCQSVIQIRNKKGYQQKNQMKKFEKGKKAMEMHISQLQKKKKKSLFPKVPFFSQHGKSSPTNTKNLKFLP